MVAVGGTYQNGQVTLDTEFTSQNPVRVIVTFLEAEESNKAAVKLEFERYKKIWKTDTMVISSTTVMINHPAYKQIITLGKDVVPLLLRDMALTSSHWFEALSSITGINPVPKEHRGKIQMMIKDWLLWATDNNIDF